MNNSTTKTEAFKKLVIDNDDCDLKLNIFDALKLESKYQLDMENFEEMLAKFSEEDIILDMFKYMLKNKVSTDNIEEYIIKLINEQFEGAVELKIYLTLAYVRTQDKKIYNEFHKNIAEGLENGFDNNNN